MDEMHAWVAQNLAELSVTAEGRKMLIRAAFAQAREDGITLLEIGEDVWGLGEFFHGNMEELVDAFETAHLEIAPEMELRLQIGLSRHCDIAYLEDCLSHFWGRKEFYSIDLYGDELAQPIENFKHIYRRDPGNTFDCIRAAAWRPRNWTKYGRMDCNLFYRAIYGIRHQRSCQAPTLESYKGDKRRQGDGYSCSSESCFREKK